MATQAFEVIRGTATMANAASTEVITESTDYTLPVGGDATNCFIRILSSRHTSTGENDGGNSDNNIPDFAVHISNPGNIATSITFTREGSTNDMRVQYEIICFVGSAPANNDFVVRATGTVSGTGQTLTASTITTIVDDADCVVFITGISHDASDSTDWHKALFTASLVANASDWDPTFDKDVADTAGTTGATVSYAVVEFTGSNWTVDRVENSTHTGSIWSGTDSNSGVIAHGVTIADIDKAVVIEEQFATNDDPTVVLSAGDASFLEDATNIRIWRRSSANTHRKVWWILQNSQADGSARNMNVQRHQYEDDTASTSREYSRADNMTTAPERSINAASIAAPLDETSVGAITCSNEDTGTYYPRGSVTIDITGANELTLYTQDASANFRWAVEIVEWPEDAITSVDTPIAVPTGPLR